MNKLSAHSIKKAQLEIKTRYLAGESVPSIARDYEVSDRDIYYHLGKLTPTEKGIHAQNYGLHILKRKEDREQNQEANTTSTPQSSESTTNHTEPSLDDFKQ